MTSANGLGGYDGGTLTVDADPNTGSALISFDAARSSPGGASIAGYQWTLDGSVYSTASAMSSSINVGAHTMSLAVTDAHGLTGYASGTLNIEEPICESSELEEGPSDPVDCTPDTSGGDGSGSDGGGSGSCSTQWIELDISYDDGETWSMWWSGYATVCDLQD